MHFCLFSVCPRSAKWVPPARALQRTCSAVHHATVPTATRLLGLRSGTVYAQLKLHERLCWNLGGMTSPQQNLPIGLRLQNALAAELLLSGRDLLVCKEAVPALSDPAEANSPRQQT